MQMIEIVFAGIRQGLPDHALKVPNIEASHPYRKNDTLDVQIPCPLAAYPAFALLYKFYCVSRLDFSTLTYLITSSSKPRFSYKCCACVLPENTYKVSI